MHAHGAKLLIIHIAIELFVVLTVCAQLPLTHPRKKSTEARAIMRILQINRPEPKKPPSVTAVKPINERSQENGNLVKRGKPWRM